MTLVFLLVGAVAAASTIGGVMWLFVWAMHQHTVALKYHALVAEATRRKALAVTAPVAKDQWLVRYKAGGALGKEVIEAQTEAGALAKFMKKGVRYTAILSIEKG